MGSALLAYRWPKRHAHVVEECRALNVRDVLPHLDAFLWLAIIPSGLRIQHLARLPNPVCGRPEIGLGGRLA